jgi:hypothetical protein
MSGGARRREEGGAGGGEVVLRFGWPDVLPALRPFSLPDEARGFLRRGRPGTMSPRFGRLSPPSRYFCPVPVPVFAPVPVPAPVLL